MAKGKEQPSNVTKVGIDSLVLDPANLRRHTERNVKAVGSSLARFGPARSIVIDDNGVVRAGNQTLESARAAGCTDVLIVDPEPGQLVAVRRRDWSASEATAYAIADNRAAELAEWDEVGLAQQLRALQGEGFDLGDVGYEAGELDGLLEKLGSDILAGEPAEAPEPQIDRAAELQAKWNTATGQLWVIPSKTTPGKEHRLLCGDSTKADDVTLVCGGKVQGAFTSPPYAEQRKEQYGGTPANEYVDWWEAIQENVRAVLWQDGSFFVNIKEHSEGCIRDTYVHELVIAHVRRWGWSYIDEFCWERIGIPDDPIKMGKFKNQWEPIFWFATQARPKFVPGNVTHQSNECVLDENYEPTLGKSQGSGKSVVGDDRLEGDGQAYPGNRIRTGNNEAIGHTAAFPPSLPAFFLHAFSDPGEAWLEPFSGSGSTIVAAEQTGRLCRGIEIVPKYVAIALERLAGMGLEPVLIEP